ncbi:pyranose 2-oxidase [Dendrothele bispora CBS 962.96]|uniref:Pyranose 2-oxidase n=1 Tax=Dendrothele bispora (strain CBS 962.96) TaxID=1314807 RepID=A0A4S8MNU8_DENBC|nr:pyranose 2-oxidase [Dendrothele bispora CBS 962.96]
MPSRLNNEDIYNLIQQPVATDLIEKADVVIAGSGPVGMTYARTILEKTKATVLMIEVGSQDSPVIGEHHKNSIKYQKDIDAFVNVIKGALQTVSAPPADTYIPTLVGDGWTPPVSENGTSTLIFQGSNPNQIREKNLKASAVTRTVGGMSTHWTCACPTPHDQEIVNNPIPKDERDKLYEQARKLLNVHNDQYDKDSEGDDISIRHNVVKKTLLENLPGNRKIQSLPLAVERRKDNPTYVTWSGANTILGDPTRFDGRFRLRTETRFTKLVPDKNDPKKITSAKLRDLKNDRDIIAMAKAYVITCGAIGTPQVLANSNLATQIPALGRYLCEQSLSFCQIVMKNEIIDYIDKNPDWKARIEAHRLKHKGDPLPIPFSDPEPQVMIPYTSDFPWHCQIHRDAFSYGDVGPRADARVVVDLRFFGRQEIKKENRVYFAGEATARGEWVAGNTDIYGMPQATFEVERSQKDKTNDQKMMKDMCAVASLLGAYLPGSDPQFMEPGLALHITGTTRIGNNPQESVADPSSRVHGFKDLWVGGNGCIPDSTGSNPTLTSVMIALKGAAAVVELLNDSQK